jgi:hypothetical protein
VDTVLSPGAAEAMRALEALRGALASERYAQYAADLLVFEVFRACSRADGVERGFCSRWSIAELAEDVARGLLAVDPQEQRTQFRFDRAGARWRAL